MFPSRLPCGHPYRQRQRDRDRETETETERHRETQTDRQTDRQTETERQNDLVDHDDSGEWCELSLLMLPLSVRNTIELTATSR